MLFRRTDWFKVRTEQGVEGWASQSDMQKTVLADGTAFRFERGDRAGFTSHHFEMGLFAGAYGGASLVSGYWSVSFNPQLALEVAAGQYLGRFSNGVTGDLGLTHVIVPEARWSPFLMLGMGEVHTEPKATLVQPSDRTEPTAYVGGGVRYYLTRRFFLRAEYKAHYVFTKRNQNEEADEWKAGIRVLLLTAAAGGAHRLRLGARLVPSPRAPPATPGAGDAVRRMQMPRRA